MNPAKQCQVIGSIDKIKSNTALVAALLLPILLYFLCRPPEISQAETSALSNKFRFVRTTLKEPAGYPYKNIRQVHPSLERIAAWISAIGAAITLADVDGDGLANDYVLVDPRTDLVTVGPLPGTGDRYPLFTLDPSPLPYDHTMAPVGCLVGDLNEDGSTDLLVYYWGRTPVAFLKKQPAAKDGQQKPQAADYLPREISTSKQLWYTGAATFSDLDGDGHQDLVFGNYFPDGSQILNPQSKSKIVLQDTNARSFTGGYKHIFLWKNATTDGNTPEVSFEEAKGVLDEQVSRGWTLAAGCHDINGDLLPEVYFAHDVGPDRLLFNQSQAGKLSFSLLEGKSDLVTPGSFVLGRDTFKGMGLDFGDINRDGKTDIYVSNIACPFGLEECHYLWLNTGNLSGIKDGIAPYQQASENLGLARGGWGWDCRLADFDNDGVPEALQAKGFIKGKVNRWPEAQALGTSNAEMLRDPRNWPAFRLGDDLSGHDPNSFFVRAGNGRYYDLANQLGLADQTLSRGIAIADVNGDGRLDFAIANQWGDSYFFHNQSSTDNKFLALRLLLPAGKTVQKAISIHPGFIQPAQPCYPAVGAEATVYLPDGSKLTTQVDGGSGHSGKRSPEIHFGLHRLADGQELKVALRWRDKSGQLQSENIKLLPGCHTILLRQQGPGEQ